MLERAKKRPLIDIKLLAGILGLLNVVHGIAMLVPLVICLIYKESIWYAFLIPALASIGFGALLFWKFKPEYEIRTREAMILVTSTWLVISIVGGFPHLLAGTLHSFTDAVFETMSGYTTTGATIYGGTRPDGIQNMPLVSVPKSILFWRSFTHWIGGLGIVVLYLAIIPLFGVGGLQMYAAEASGPTADKLTPRVQDTAKILWLIYSTLTFAQFLLLFAHPSMDWFDALNHAFSTVATGGFSTLDSSVKGFSSAYIDSVITLFMFLAGVNFSLYYYVYRGEVKKVLQDREFRMYAFVTFLFSVALSLSLWKLTEYDFLDSMRYGVFQAVSILTTTGFVIDDYELWPTLSSSLIFLLLIQGGSAGSTAGGIKIIHLLITLRFLKREMQLMLHPKAVIPVRLGTKVISNQVLYVVSSFVLMYFLASLLGAFLISAFGLDLITSFSAAFSCLGNVGPGFGTIGPVENFASMPDGAKWVQLLLMEIGRLEIFTVLIVFTRSFWKQ